ncbi:MAG TPA: DUF971 domain-containing protein [Deltaproteobacteria bacterium]|nr:DUF971 domain-containing protein [Deltaproteobacteria bacterium]
MFMSEKNQIPKEMNWLEKNNEFIILWKDDHKSTFSMPFLRKKCPCALCREKRENKNPLKLFEEQSPQALHISPVGHYAIQIEWADGHSSGIYTFDMLRRLCSCSHCKNS